MSIKSAKQIVDEAYAALLTKGDIDGFLAHFDENSELIEAESLPYAGHYHGKDAIRGLVQSLFTYWKDVDYDIERTVFDDEYVAGFEYEVLLRERLEKFVRHRIASPDFVGESHGNEADFGGRVVGGTLSAFFRHKFLHSAAD